MLLNRFDPLRCSEAVAFDDALCVRVSDSAFESSPKPTDSCPVDAAFAFELG